MPYTNLLAAAGQTLLEQFDIKTIFTILLLVFFAIIEIMRGVDYLRNKGKNKIKQLEQEEQRISSLEKLAKLPRLTINGFAESFNLESVP